MATLIIENDKDVIEHSVVGNTMKFQLKDEKFEQAMKFKHRTGFTLLNYICDTMMPEFVIGVNKYENCILFDINESNNTVSIEGNKHEYFNTSQINKIRKYRIDAILDDD